MKTSAHIEIVSSNDTTLSSMSAKSRAAIHAVLSKQFTDVRISLVDCLEDLEALVVRQPDLVVLGVKFIPQSPALSFRDPAKIWVSSYLQAAGIAHTGSDAAAHQRELYKHAAKECVAEAGLQTAAFFLARQHVDFSNQDMALSYPVFIKPANRGGGLGIDAESLAHTFSEVTAKVTAITTNLRSDSIIEEYLPGREFSVAILKQTESTEYSVFPIELVAEEDEYGVRLLSCEQKEANTEQVLAVTDPVLRTELSDFALDAFRALGARDYGRIDIRLDAHGTPHFLEANLIPSLIDNYGSFPKACKLNDDLSYETVILQIIELGLSRSDVVFDRAGSFPLHPSEPTRSLIQLRELV